MSSPIAPGDAYKRDLWADARQEMTVMAIKYGDCSSIKTLSNAVQRDAYDFWKRYGFRKARTGVGRAKSQWGYREVSVDAVDVNRLENPTDWDVLEAQLYNDFLTHMNERLGAINAGFDAINYIVSLIANMGQHRWLAEVTKYPAIMSFIAALPLDENDKRPLAIEVFGDVHVDAYIVGYEDGGLLPGQLVIVGDKALATKLVKMIPDATHIMTRIVHAGDIIMTKDPHGNQPLWAYMPKEVIAAAKNMEYLAMMGLAIKDGLISNPPKRGKLVQFPSPGTIQQKQSASRLVVIPKGAELDMAVSLLPRVIDSKLEQKSLSLPARGRYSEETMYFSRGVPKIKTREFRTVDGGTLFMLYRQVYDDMVHGLKNIRCSRKQFIDIVTEIVGHYVKNQKFSVPVERLDIYILAAGWIASNLASHTIPDGFWE